MCKKKRAIALKAIGCRTNQQEIASLIAALETNGHTIADSLYTADTVIINTCCVTHTAETKTLRAIKTLISRNPAAEIMVTGCFVQNSPERFSAFTQIRWIVGNALKKEIPQILTSKPGLYHTTLDSAAALSRFSTQQEIISAARLRTRYALKMQEGCNFQCAYCIVPQVRGKSRSVPSQQLIETVNAAVQNSFKEIVLSGTHIGQYLDPVNGYRMLDLLKEFVAIPGDFRIRLSSLDPREISPELLTLVEQNRKICNYLHISVQSLCGSVLRNMGRWTEKTETVLENIQRLKHNCPTLALGGDFIVGFPGETDQNFEETLAMVKKTGFTYGHVFRFSKRENTPAWDMENQVSEKEKTERSARLRATLDAGHEAFIDTCMGKTFRIITEKEKPLMGLTDNYIRIAVPGLRVPKNSWLTVELTEREPFQKNVYRGIHREH